MSLATTSLHVGADPEVLSRAWHKPALHSKILRRLGLCSPVSCQRGGSPESPAGKAKRRFGCAIRTSDLGTSLGSVGGACHLPPKNAAVGTAACFHTERPQQISRQKSLELAAVSGGSLLCSLLSKPQRRNRESPEPACRNLSNVFPQ